MSGLRGELGFIPVKSSEPSFNVVLSTAAQLFQVESTVRIWQGGHGRSIRFNIEDSVNWRLVIGSSLAVVTSSACILMSATAPRREVILVDGLTTSTGTWVSIMTTSTAVPLVNITPGYGGY